MPPKDDASGSLVQHNDKPYVITNIKAHIPTVLDLEELNFKQWKSLFNMHCIMDHDNAWIKDDTIVKMWIYNTISKPILQMVMKEDETAHQLWDRIAALFQNNKEARQMQLTDDLRNMQIGDMSMTKYCHKIKVIADLLENIGKPIDDSTLVMHTIHGLGEKYETVAGIIRHRVPFPSFSECRTILEMEETRLARMPQHQALRDSSSSSTVLLARGTNNRNNNNNNSNLCRNFQSGFCSYGEKCKFIHSGSTRFNNNNRQQGRDNQQNNYHQFAATFTPPQQRHQFMAPPGFHSPMQYGPAFGPGYGSSPIGPRPGMFHNGSFMQPHLNLDNPPPGFGQSRTSHEGPTSTGHGGNAGFAYNNMGNGQAYFTNSASLQPQVSAYTATTLPQAFSNMTFKDNGQPDRYMDTGATSHLTSDAGPSDSKNSS